MSVQTKRTLTTSMAAFLVASVAVLNPTATMATPKEQSAPAAADTVMLESSDTEAKEAIEAASPVLNDLPHGAVADLDNAQVSQPEGTDKLMVAVQLSGEDYDKGSFAGVVVDPETGKTSNQVQVKATQSSDAEAQVTTWVNGDSQGTKHVNTSAEASDAQAASLQGADPDVLDCLNALGITTAVALIIISTCATACAATVGVGCVVCVAGFTAVGGASVGKCLST